MSGKYLLLSITVFTIASVCLCPAASAVPGWQVTQLTDNEYDDRSPKASEGQVVWVADDGNDTEIMFYNGTSTIQLTNNSYDETNPQISGNNIVWTGFDGQDWEIFYYNGSTTQLTNNTYNDTNPSISGNKIAWQGSSGTSKNQIFFYDGSTTTQITTYGPDVDNSNPVIDGNNIVWVLGCKDTDGRYERQILLYDGSDTTSIAGDIKTIVKHLSIKGKFVVWNKKYKKLWRVYRHNILTEETSVLGNTSMSNTSPDTSAKYTVWQERDKESHRNIYISIMSRHKPYKKLVVTTWGGSGDIDNIQPCISDYKVVWIRQRNSLDSVYLRDGGSTIKLSTTDSYSILPPYIQDTTITWAQRDANDFEIWVAIPQPVYVDDSAPGPHTGLSWENAYTTIQDALAVASDGDEIRVAQGTYYPDEGAGQIPDDKNSTFLLIADTALKGAYAGYGAPNPDERDPNLYETILSGDLKQDNMPITEINDLFYNGYRYDNALNVVTGPAVDEQAILDGFTITSGRGQLNKFGGGLKCNNDSILKVSDCKFELNQAAGGGAIYKAYGQLVIENCTFQTNLAITGGAIYTQTTDVNIIDCNFTGNCAQLISGPLGLSRMGGAVITYDGTSSIRADNYAVKYSGAIHYDALEDVTTDTYDCTFIGNRSNLWGGAILYLTSGTGNIANCSFINNSSEQGAGLAIYNSIRPYITNCEFIANFSTGSGGAIWNGHNCSPTIFGSLFVGNSAADSGGAVLCTNYNNIESGRPKFYNCTFVDNSAPLGSLVACEKDSPSSYGPSTVNFYNSIIWQSGNLVHIDDGSTVKIKYSDVLGGYTGFGNFDADPCFVTEPNDGGDGFGDDPNTTPLDEAANNDYGNLRLLDNSPCIDRGHNSMVHLDYADLDNDGYIAEPVPFDLDGFGRFTDYPDAIDLGTPSTTQEEIIDLGSYEKGVCGDDGHPYPDGDVNGDCYVDFVDFAIVADNWLMCTHPDCDQF